MNKDLTRRCCAFESLAKGERKGLNAGIEELDLKGHIFGRPLLPDELIHPRLPNLARAIGAGIGSMIVAGCSAIQLQPEAMNSKVPPARTLPTALRAT